MKSIDIMKKVSTALNGKYKLPEDFAEGFSFEKEEIINPDVIEEDDLRGFGENLLAYDTTFDHNEDELTLFTIISEDNKKCMFLVSSGDLNPEEILEKGYIQL